MFRNNLEVKGGKQCNNAFNQQVYCSNCSLVLFRYKLHHIDAAHAHPDASPEPWQGHQDNHEAETPAQENGSIGKDSHDHSKQE